MTIVYFSSKEHTEPWQLLCACPSGAVIFLRRETISSLYEWSLTHALLVKLNKFWTKILKVSPLFSWIHCTHLPYTCTAGRVHFQQGWTLFHQHTPSCHTHILREQIQTLIMFARVELSRNWVKFNWKTACNRQNKLEKVYLYILYQIYRDTDHRMWNNTLLCA